MKFLLSTALIATGFSLFAYQDSATVVVEEVSSTTFGSLAHSSSVNKMQAMYDLRRRNILKLNLMSLPFKNLSFQYERSLIPNISVAVGFRIMSDGTLPLRQFSSELAKEFKVNNQDVINIVHNTRANGWAVTPELKFFLGAGNGKGFYLAPFYRYETFTLNTVYQYIDDQNEIAKVDFSGLYKSSGVGLQIGVQFLLANRLNIDWWIAGPYYATQTGSLNADYNNMSVANQENLRRTLEGLNMQTTTINYTVTPNVTASNASAVIKGTSYLARLMGVTIGVKF